ncbi:TPA: OmpW family protein [Burkholderia cenocepacia]|uniref:OmpW/AlkL family protein n=1 Tax=unclassified Burkholderia TaxID=2613784 RepID=UPI00158F33B7|nr:MULTISPECIES: OmpW family outer membrane protein [unclassified Burkholderia]HEF5872085.1 OmpW family protein [Burkholderia cenocepacia]
MKKLIVAGVVAGVSTLASAQQAGDNVATLGWLHIMPQDSTNGLTTNLANMPINGPLRLPGSFTSPGTSLTVNNADTVGLTLTHFFTDHIAVTSVLGIPPEFTLTGHGVIRPPGPAGALGNVDMDKSANQPAVKNARQWSPTVILQYYFNSPTAKFRPFVGIGVAYSWFSNIELNGNFAKDINENLGSVLAAGAGKPGATSVEGKASSSFTPVYNVGASYAIDKHWGLTATLTYMPLKTYSSLVIKAADGSTLATTRTRLKADPLITFVGISYKF